MSQMRKTASMKTPARKRLRSRFSDAAGSTDAGIVDAPASEPQPTTSHPEKPATTLPRTRSTIKRTNNTRQTKRKGAAASEPKPVPLHKTKPATLSNHPGGDGRDSDSGPAAVPPTPVVKKKIPRLPRQGTRSSARLRGRDPTVTHEPTPIEPKKKQTKRKRGPDGEGNPAELPKKRGKGTDDQTDTPPQVGTSTPSGDLAVDLAPSESVTADHHEQPADVVAEGDAVAGPSEYESYRLPRFFLENQRGFGVVIKLGYPGS